MRNKVGVAGGFRTPFVKADGAFKNISAQELGRQLTSSMLVKLHFKPKQVIFGNVCSPIDASNIARVIALQAGLPVDVIAHTVNRNCGSGFQSITDACEIINRTGENIVAGGVESMSNAPLVYNAEAVERFKSLAKSKSMWQKIKALFKFRPRHFNPVIALKLGLTDPTNGMMMGNTAELLANEFGISREAQDAFAIRSHDLAIRSKSIHDEEISKFFTTSGECIEADVGPRVQTVDTMAKLQPVFDKHGTVTVGNSCGITDGAAAISLHHDWSGERSKMGYIVDYAYVGLDPSRMGLGPVFAIKELLDRHNLRCSDIGLFEINEAFAAQILAVQIAAASKSFADKHFNGSIVGTIDDSKLNVNGGAIAIGHPVGASGTRLVITLLRELRRRNLKYGIAALCIGGGQGGAILVESDRDRGPVISDKDNG